MVIKLLRLLGLFLVVSLLNACASSQQGWADSPLKDTTWRLVTVESRMNDLGRQYVGSMADIQMTLLASGEAKLKIGCQNGQSEWRATPTMLLTKGDIEFEMLEIDASSCEPNILVNRFKRTFRSFQGYLIVENHLYLVTQAGEAIWGWRRVE